MCWCETDLDTEKRELSKAVRIFTIVCAHESDPTQPNTNLGVFASTVRINRINRVLRWCGTDLVSEKRVKVLLKYLLQSIHSEPG